MNEAPKTQPSAKPKGKSRWWSRWTKRLAITALCARIVLWVFLEQIANFGASYAGLSVSWESASLSICTLSLAIQDLVVRDADDHDAPTLLTAEYLNADVSMRRLLRGQLSVTDAGINNALVTVHRNPNGSLRLPKGWLTPPTVSLPQRPKDIPEEDAPFNFQLPLWIASTRLHNVQFDFVDHSTIPQTQHTGQLELDLADIGIPDRHGSLTLRLQAPGICQELFLQTQVELAAKTSEVNFQATVAGFRPQQFDLPQPAIDAIDNAQIVDLRLSGELNAEILTHAPKHPALTGFLDVGLTLDDTQKSAFTAQCGPTRVTGEDTVDASVIMPFSLFLRSEGIVDALRIQNGRFELSDTRTAVTADLSAEQITCSRFQPALTQSGMSLPTNGIDLEAMVDAEFGDSISLDLAKVSVKEGSQELLTIKRMTLRDLRTVNETLAIDSLELTGPILPLQKNSDGSIAFAGLQIDPNASKPTQQDANRLTAPTPAKKSALPKIRLGSLNFKGTELRFTDASLEPPATLAVQNLNIRGDAITIGEEAPPGRLTLSCSIQNVVQQFTTAVSLSSSASKLRATVNCDTNGITCVGLTPWLRPLGIEPELNNASLKLLATFDASLTDGGVRASAQLGDMRFTDAGQDLLSLTSLRGDGVEFENDFTDFGSWVIAEPYLRVHKDQQQLIHALGFQFGQPTTTQETADLSKPVAAAKLATDDSSGNQFRFGELNISQTTLDWSDARYPDQKFSIGLDATIGTTTASNELPISIALRLDQAVETVEVTALLKRAPSGDTVEGQLIASSIHGGELDMLLPAGMNCTLVDGSLRATFDAALQQSNSSAVKARLRDLVLQDEAAEVAAIDEIELDIPSVTDQELHIKDAHALGIRAIVKMTPEALLLPGFAISNKAKQPPVSTAPETPAQIDAESKSNLLTLPGLRIDALALELERLEIRDQRIEASKPIIIRTAIQLTEPWLGDPTADTPSAMQLQIGGDCEPLSATFTAKTSFSPFNLTPTLDIDFSLDGLNTTQLHHIFPSTKDQLQGEATALSARASLHAYLNMRRRDPRVFNFNRSLGAELTLENIVLRDAKSKKPCLSIASIDAIARSIQPQSGSLLLRSLTIDDPQINIFKDAAGTHIAGLLLPTTESAAAESTNDTALNSSQTNEAAATPSTNSAQLQTIAKTQNITEAPEFAIDRIDLLGLDLDYQDITTEPPTHVSLIDTDAQLRRFSTRVLTEPRPMSFSMEVRSGPVELERRIIKSSALAGLLVSSAQALVGANRQHDYEQRAMLDELGVDGHLQLYPATLGNINMSLTSLELAAFRGLAKQAGVDLTDGLYDMRLSVDMLGYDGINIRSQHVFTHLVLDEPANGPIYRYLRLPAPIQAVLFLLRNQNGQQRIPISLHVPASGVSQSTIVNLAVENLIKLIGESARSAPSRLISATTGGLFSSSNHDPQMAVEIPFEAGSPLPEVDGLAPLIQALANDETLSVELTHEMGAGDEPFAFQLGNPDNDIIEVSIARLQAKRAELDAERKPIARDVVAFYGAGKVQEAIRRQNELRTLENHLGELLTGLDEAIDQIDNPSKRKALRRSRRCAIALGEARIDAITAELLRGCPGLANNAKSNDRTRIERRPGRGFPVAGLPSGGRVVAVIRRRVAQDLPPLRPTEMTQQAISEPSSAFMPVPGTADPTNRAFRNR